MASAMPRPGRSPISSSSTFARTIALMSFITPTRQLVTKNGVPMLKPAELRPWVITGRMSARLLSIAAALSPSPTTIWTSTPFLQRLSISALAASERRRPRSGRSRYVCRSSA